MVRSLQIVLFFSYFDRAFGVKSLVIFLGELPLDIISYFLSFSRKNSYTFACFFSISGLLNALELGVSFISFVADKKASSVSIASHLGFLNLRSLGFVLPTFSMVEQGGVFFNIFSLLQGRSTLPVDILRFKDVKSDFAILANFENFVKLLTKHVNPSFLLFAKFICNIF